VGNRNPTAQHGRAKEGEFMHRRRGVTLIEMLASLATIALFIALLIPAVQKVRETANKTLCGNNLRQIGLALHHYQHDHGRLPPGYLGPIPNEADVDGSNGPHVGTLPLIFAYLEQDNVLKLLAIDQTASAGRTPWWEDPVNLDTSYKKLSLLRCPSVDNYEDTQGTAIAVHFYHVPSGPMVSVAVHPPGQTHPLGRTNYLGVAGGAGKGTNAFWGRYEGILANRSSTTLGEVTARDGTSNTLLLGEFCGGIDQVQETFAASWVGAAAMGTFQGLPTRNMRPQVNPPPTAPPAGFFGRCGCGAHGSVSRRGGLDISYWFSFSSRHPAGVQFCFADGSVRLLRRGDTAVWHSEQWYVLQRLAGKGDGQQADFAAVSD
jgi:prepilin-type processing-associated H-X9-DG protein